MIFTRELNLIYTDIFKDVVFILFSDFHTECTVWLTDIFSAEFAFIKVNHNCTLGSLAIALLQYIFFYGKIV